PSNLHPRAVKPIHIQLTELEDDIEEDKPYWNDAIDKYFD
ncbi:23146_t:CDS:1, partial [Gigaspora rosea]